MLQRNDVDPCNIINDLGEDEILDFSMDEDQILRFHGRICVPNDKEFRTKLLIDAHSSWSSIHPGATKMYQNFKEHFWWHRMKRHITEFVSQCLTCQQVKVEHRMPAGLLHPLSIPE